MALIYKKYQNKNAQSRIYGKWLLKPVWIGDAGIEEIADAMQASCTVKRADVLAVLSELGPTMKSLMQQSKRVTIPYLGSFKISINCSKGAQTNEDDATPQKCIKGNRIIYQPVVKKEGKKYVKELCRGLGYQWFNSLLGPKEQITPKEEGNDEP